jgi:hypothetical protein
MVRWRGVASFVFGLALGAVYDITGVLFVQAVSSRSAAYGAAISMVLGALSLSGIDTALRSRAGLAGVVLGYGLGTYASVRWFSMWFSPSS